MKRTKKPPAVTRSKKAEWAWDNLVDVTVQRDTLAIALSTVFPSHLAPYRSTKKGDERRSDRKVLCVHTPAGQLAWLLPPDAIALCAHLQETPSDWDGHTGKDRQVRLLQLLGMIDSSAFPKNPA